MNKIFTLLLGIFLPAFCFSQISFTGSSGPVSTGSNAATVIVDNALVVTSPITFDGARVSITTNFASGDALGYSSAALPSGVTGSYNSSSGILTFSGTATASAYQALLRTVTFTASANGTGDRDILFNLGSAIVYNNTGHFYNFVPGNFTWSAAKADAATKTFSGLTGYLATITSDGENQFIQLKVGADGWIGGSDDYAEINAAKGSTVFASQSASEGKFHWVTGPEAGTLYSTGNTNPVAASGQYNNWNAGEPNNSGGNEHYAQIYIGGSFPGKWNDLPNAGNSTTVGYIVEFGGLPGDPVVDLTHSRTVEVQNTAIVTTPCDKVYNPSIGTVVDDAVTVTSGALISNTRVTVSGNFVSGDKLSFSSASLPAGVSGSSDAVKGVLSFTGTATPAAWQALFRTVSFLPSASSLANRVVTFSTGNLISGDNGHFYEFISAAASNWAAAKTAADARTYMGLHGYLATVTSMKENDLIRQKLSADGWLGGSDEYQLVNGALGASTYANQSASEGRFYWVTGPEKGQAISVGDYPSTTIPTGAFANWYTGEPNNYNNNEHYIEIYSSSSQPGTWNDLPASNGIGYVVEYGGLPTDPAVALSASRTLVVAVTLPVNGLQFTAVQKGAGAVALHWASPVENDAVRYEVQHSTDGILFTSLATVNASSVTSAQYDYIDSKAAIGVNFYRLAVFARNGGKAFSDVRAVTLADGVAVYPTVVQQQFVVRVPSAQPVTIAVYNSAGAAVYREAASQEANPVDATSWPKGFYVVQVTAAGGQCSTFRICKQ